MLRTILMTIGAVAMLTSHAGAFDSALSNSVTKKAIADIRGCGDGKCAASALKGAAGKFSGKPDYRGVASALRKVAGAVEKCGIECPPEKSAAAKKLAQGYKAEFGAAKRAEIRTLAAVFESSQYKFLR